MSKYPQRVPIIVDCKKELKLDKNKYIVPNDLTVGQFMYILKKRINIFNYAYLVHFSYFCILKF